MVLYALWDSLQQALQVQNKDIYAASSMDLAVETDMKFIGSS